jgi:hypothetical protein
MLQLTVPVFKPLPLSEAVWVMVTLADGAPPDVGTLMFAGQPGTGGVVSVMVTAKAQLDVRPAPSVTVHPTYVTLLRANVEPLVTLHTVLAIPELSVETTFVYVTVAPAVEVASLLTLVQVSAGAMVSVTLTQK